MIPGSDRFWSALGAPRLTSAQLRKALSREDALAVSRYEALENDPWATGTWLDENGKEHHGSVGELLRWQQSRYLTARDLLRSTLEELLAERIVSVSDPGTYGPDASVYAEGIGNLRSVAAASGGYDPRFQDPTKFLAWPRMDHWAIPRPYQVPSDMPIPSRVQPVFLTPKAFDPSQFNGDAYRRTIDRLASGLVDYVRSVNANPALCPAMLFGSSYPHEIGGDNPPFNPDVAMLKRNHPTDWRDYWVRYLYKAVQPPDPNTDPATTTYTTQGYGNPHWELSLARRCRSYYPTGPMIGDHFSYYCADAMMDLNELLQVARFILDTGPSATFYSTVQYHKVLYRLSKQRLGVREGVSPAGYLAMLDREQKARQRRGLANATALVTMGKYELKDSDGVEDVIAQGSVATLGAAVGAAGIAATLGATAAASLGVGAIAAAVIVGIAVLVGFLTDDTRVVIDAVDTWPLDDPGATHKFASNPHRPLTMRQVILARPIIDWRVR